MFASPVFDIAGPGTLLLAGGLFFAVFSIGTLVIESLALWLLKWGSFGRSLLASFLMNLASTIVGFILLAFSFYVGNFYTLFLVEFLLSVLIEGGVLMLLKRDAARQNWSASFVANVASYVFLAVALFVINRL
jgi:hypothetical protein